MSKQPASSQYAILDSKLTQKWNTRGVDRAELLVVFLEMVSVELMGFFQGSDVLVRHLLSNSKEAGWLEGALTSERRSLRSDTIALHRVLVRHLLSNSKKAGWLGAERAQ